MTRFRLFLENMDLKKLSAQIESCEACPRLRRHCLKVAREKRKSYATETYWGKPIAGFGDPKARLHILGLAPAAHGANRTGRIFTGDRSGEWLYRALHKAGFANQPTSLHRNDGLKLKDCWISCVVRCAPPDNKPEPREIERCSAYLSQEFELMKNPRVYLALGQIALHAAWPLLVKRFALKSHERSQARPKFSHGGKMELAPGHWLLMSYHPSQQNTFTGRLTEPMFDSIFTEARNLLTTPQ
jgi:uracil-DNA glycosylase family 4